MVPKTVRRGPIPNADLDTDSDTDPDADAGRFSCAGGEGHPFMTVRARRSFGFPSPRREGPREGRRYLPMRTAMRVNPRTFLKFTL